MKTTYICPICKEPLVSQEGNQLNPKDGFTVYCPNPFCKMQDWGHGKNVEKANEIFQQKCEF